MILTDVKPTRTSRNFFYPEFRRGANLARNRFSENGERTIERSISTAFCSAFDRSLFLSLFFPNAPFIARIRMLRERIRESQIRFVARVLLLNYDCRV